MRTITVKRILYSGSLRLLFAVSLLGVLASVALAAPPTHVRLSGRFTPADARAGEGAQVAISVEIEPGWHLYSLTQPDGGPLKTTLQLASTALVPAGNPVQGPFKKEHDAGFNMDIQVYEGHATFGIPVMLKKGVRGVQTATVAVRYQVCDAKTCLPPKTVQIPITFKVTPGAARAARMKPIRSVPKNTAWNAEIWPRRFVDAPGSLGTLIFAGGPPDTPTPPATTDEFSQNVQQAQNGGLLKFLLLSFGAGFAALLAPCVFPIIPLTVNFFAKRKADNPKQGVRDALAYCFGIVGTFTGLGLSMTVLFGATGIQRIATNPWVNLAMAALFVVLALSLMEVFELRLPAGLANSAQAKTQSAGILGPLFMGLTFTLTSFTCTVAFVGTLLAAAAGGSYLYPTLGMLAFSTAFASPFFLLALFPQYLSRLPKSGAWLVTVKTFMGMVELAAALKFLSAADLVWQKGWLTRPVFLAIWALIAFVTALYLFGAILFAQEPDRPRIGWPRRAFGALSLAAGFYCLAAINGKSLGTLEAFVPPYEYPGTTLVTAKAGAPVADGPTVWLHDYKTALAQAKAQNRPVLINFTGVTCTNCRLMEKEVFPNAAVKREFANFVTVELYTDRGTKEDDANQELEVKLTGVNTLPVYVIVSPTEKVVKVHQDRTQTAEEFATFLQQGRGTTVSRVL